MLRILGANASVLVIEEDPQTRLVNYYGHEYQLAFPWVYYVVTCGLWAPRHTLRGTPRYTLPRQPTGMFFFVPTMRAQPVTSFNDEVLALPLPNTYGFEPCFAKSELLGVRTDQRRAFVQMYTAWWESVFNTDGSFHLVEIGHRGIVASPWLQSLGVHHVPFDRSLDAYFAAWEQRGTTLDWASVTYHDHEWCCCTLAQLIRKDGEIRVPRLRRRPLVLPRRPWQTPLASSND